MKKLCDHFMAKKKTIFYTHSVERSIPHVGRKLTLGQQSGWLTFWVGQVKNAFKNKPSGL